MAYDVALSFAGEDRAIALELKQEFEKLGLSVFYDHDEEHVLWGANLIDTLRSRYGGGARYVVVLVSKNYVKKKWTQHELASAQSHKFSEGPADYILPLQLDDTKDPRIPEEIGYLSYQAKGSGGIARALYLKVRGNVATNVATASLPSSSAKIAASTVPSLNRKPYGLEGLIEFDSRMGLAFPGIREFQWIENAEVCARRLEVLLAEPLKLDGENFIWWFRGPSSMFIRSFRVDEQGVSHFDIKSMLVRRLGVYRHPTYWRSMVYVEADGLPPVGIYEHTSDSIRQSVRLHGYASEEFAWFEGRPIKRTEYDDGSAVIDGKVVRVRKAALEHRILTRYSMIICAQMHPVNNASAELELRRKLDQVQEGKLRIESLLSVIDKLPPVHQQ